MAPTLYYFLLLTCCGYALFRGRSEERTVAIACLLATLASVVLILSSHNRFAGIESGVLVVDGLTFAVFLVVALKSSRFWPLWVAGLHLTGGLAHMLRIFDVGLMPTAYSVAVQFWAYPILLILAVGTWRGRHHFGGTPLGQPSAA